MGQGVWYRMAMAIRNMGPGRGDEAVMGHAGEGLQMLRFKDRKQVQGTGWKPRQAEAE